MRISSPNVLRFLLLGFIGWTATPANAQSSCPNGPAAAARAAVASMPSTMSAENIILRRGINFRPIDRVTGGWYSVSIEVDADWKAYRGSELLTKHEALCYAGDAEVAEQLGRWFSEARGGRDAAILGSAAFLVGLIGAAATYDEELDGCTYGFEGECPGSMKAFVYTAAGGLVLTFGGVGFVLYYGSKYGNAVPPQYARTIFEQYNRELEFAVRLRRE